MNFFKNLPCDVLNNIYELCNPYKIIFNDIIKNNVLHSAVKQRYIKNIKEKYKYEYDDIKCLYNFIFDINLKSQYSYMDITKITYKKYNYYYTIYYNNKAYFNVIIINNQYYNIRNENFYFYNKSYDHYLIYMDEIYEDGDICSVHNYSGNPYQSTAHHNSGVRYTEIENYEDPRYNINDDIDNSDDEVVIDESDYFQDYLFIKNIFGHYDNYDPKTETEFLVWIVKYYNSYFKDDYEKIIKTTNKRNKKWLKNLI